MSTIPEPVALWEILVPTEKRIKTEKPERDDGYGSDAVWQDMLEVWRIKNSYTTRYHRVWDRKVREISGGLTIMTPVKGEWESGNGELFRERMIPVRFLATREQAEETIDMTMVYYDQLAILCYKLSNDVILKHR